MKRKSSALTLLFLFLLLVCLSCNEDDKIAIEKSASVFDIEQGKASIEQSNLQFMKAVKKGDSVGVARCYTRNARVLIDEIPTVEGYDSILHYYGSLIEKGIKEFKLSSQNIWGDSSILVEEGKFTLLGEDKEELDKGNYIVLWQTEGGNWKMFRHICKSDYPSDALLPKPVVPDSVEITHDKIEKKHGKK